MIRSAWPAEKRSIPGISYWIVIVNEVFNYQRKINVAPRKNDRLRHDFPAGLAQPALRALSAAGYTRLAQLTNVKEADLLKLHGMGPKAIELLRSALEADGRPFADTD